MGTFADLNLLDCANCRLQTGPELPDISRPLECPHCGKKLAAYVFPALMRAAPAAPAQGPTVIGAESSCFYHAAKRASAACDVCGRFLCDLCDVQIDGEHRCPQCIESSAKEKKTGRAGQRYVYYDSVALVLALAGLVLYPFAFMFAPAALYYVFRHWKSPRSVMPRGRWRFVVAAVLAAGELLGYVFFIYAMMS